MSPTDALHGLPPVFGLSKSSKSCAHTMTVRVIISNWIIKSWCRTELAKLTRKLKKKDSDTEALYERRERLQESIDEFCRLARIYIPSIDHDQSIQR